MPPKVLSTPTDSSVMSPSTETSSVFNSTNPSTKAASLHHPQAPADFGILVATRIRPFNKKELAEHVSQQKAEIKDPNEPPVPVMDVETDGKTMILLDPKDLSSRASFFFDYIFTPFAPTVELNPAKRKGSTIVGVDVAAPSPLSPLEGSSSDEEDESEEMIAERAQAEVYAALGAPIVKSAWEGYNACIFAYGQTSSGKTYTMMGTKRDPGVIPRLCKDLFERIELDESRQKLGLEPTTVTPTTTNKQGGTPLGSPAAAPPLSRRMVKVTVSYMEIYNEQVRDLLKPRPKGQKPKFNLGPGDMGEEYQSLKVRQHPLHGPFVEGLTTVDVDNWLECVRIIRQGNDVRSHCTTEMNESSSRSHAIFQMILTQTEALGARVRGRDVTNHKVSKINLVDLAGSERILRTNVSGKHLTEAQSINQSLSTLRRVIDALVQKKKGGAVAATLVVPYRESMLTWILSDNFGGNSKTVMCANVSPHSSNSSESESTLRYATLARGIVNRIRINEDPSAKLIRELQNQLKVLQEEMKSGPQQTGRVEELMEEIAENKRAMEDLSVKEEGMKRLITESRAREEKLLSDVQSHQEGEERWKREAEKLRKEKEELRRALKDIAKSNPELVAQTKESNFWSIDLDDNVESLVPDDSTSCPPPMSRRKSSMRIKRQSLASNNDISGTTKSVLSPRAFDKKGAPSPMRADTKIALWQLGDAQHAGRGGAAVPAFLEGEMSPLVPATTAPKEVIAPQPSVSSQSPSSDANAPRFGRRAATEEGAERKPDDVASRNSDRPMSEQYLQQLNSRLAAGKGPTRTSVGSIPLSLQHLAGLTTLPTTTTNVFGSESPSLRSPDPLTPPSTAGVGRVPPKMVGSSAQPVPTTAPVVSKPKQAPDALDAFLEGGGTQESKPQRGAPPWRKAKK